jgi:hypothetical protein
MFHVEIEEGKEATLAICDDNHSCVILNHFYDWDEFLEFAKKNALLFSKSTLTKVQHQVSAAYYGYGWGSKHETSSKARFRKVSSFNKIERKYSHDIKAEYVASSEWLYEAPLVSPNALERNFTKFIDGPMNAIFQSIYQDKLQPKVALESLSVYKIASYLAFTAFRSRKYIADATHLTQAAHNSLQRRGVISNITAKASTLAGLMDIIEALTQRFLARVIVQGYSLSVQEASGFITSDQPNLLFDSAGGLLPAHALDAAYTIYMPISSKVYFVLRVGGSNLRYSKASLNRAQATQADQWLIGTKNQKLDFSPSAQLTKLDSSLQTVFDDFGSVSYIPTWPRDSSGRIIWSAANLAIRSEYEKFCGADLPIFLDELYHTDKS